MKTMISRRGFLCAAGIASASAVLTACGGSSSSTASSTASSAAASSEAASGESMELIVFAAASLTETLNAIAETYSAENPGVTFSFNFDSSGTLKTQIQEGADCDLFISAGQKQMNQLDSTASAEVNTEGLDFVDAESRVDLLENKVVLCVPEGSDKGIDSFDSLAEHLKAEDILFCMGNSDVPWVSTPRRSWPTTIWMRQLWLLPVSSPTVPTSRKSPLRSARPAWMPVSFTAPMRTAPV